MRIAEYSRAMLKEFEAEENIQFEGRQKGILQIFRTDEEMAEAKADLAILQEWNTPVRLLNSALDCVEYEPALAHMAGKLAGG